MIAPFSCNSCIYFISKYICKAFPNGIPEDILSQRLVMKNLIQVIMELCMKINIGKN